MGEQVKSTSHKRVPTIGIAGNSQCTKGREWLAPEQSDHSIKAQGVAKRR